MVTVHTIATQLTAKTADFEAGMKKGKSLIKDFSAQFGSIGNIAAGVTLGSMIENAASKLKSLVASSFEAGVAQAALSETLGISASQLAGLQLAADYAEVSQDDLASSLFRLRKNIGEAVTGGGELAQSFTKLGLDARQLSALDEFDAFSKVADALSAVQNEYTRATLTQDVLGKSGLKLANILKGGSEALQQAQHDAVLFGTALRDIDIERFKAMDDEMDKLAAATKGAGLAIASDLAPWITKATNAWLRYYEAAKGRTTTGLENRTWESLAASIEKTNKAATGLKAGPLKADVELLKKTMEEVQTPTEKVIDKIQQIEAAMARGAIPVDVFRARFAQLMDELDKPINDGIESLEKAVRDLGLTAKEIDLNEAFLHGADDDQMAIIAGLHDQIDAHKKLEEAMKSNAKWQMKLGEDAKKIWEDTQTPLEEFRNDAEKAGELFSEGFLDQETFERALLGYKNKLEDTFKMADSGTSAKLRGSQEAFSAIDKYSRSNDPGRTLQSLLKQAERQSAIQARLAKETAQEMANLIAVQGI